MCVCVHNCDCMKQIKRRQNVFGVALVVPLSSIALTVLFTSEIRLEEFN